MKLYSIYDSKAQVFAVPFPSLTHAEAQRAWKQAVNDSRTPYCKYPEDYTLFCVGEFDVTTAVLTASLPENLGMASRFVSISSLEQSRSQVDISDLIAKRTSSVAPLKEPQ